MYFVQWKLNITRSLGPRQFVLYIRYFVISVVKQYTTKEINSLGPEKFDCYIIIRYFVILYQISLYRVLLKTNSQFCTEEIAYHLFLWSLIHLNSAVMYWFFSLDILFAVYSNYDLALCESYTCNVFFFIAKAPREISYVEWASLGYMHS